MVVANQYSVVAPNSTASTHSLPQSRASDHLAAPAPIVPSTRPHGPPRPEQLQKHKLKVMILIDLVHVLDRNHNSRYADGVIPRAA